MKTIAFFNNNGGVGKTTLVYHLAVMFARQHVRTLALDLDPQANLTALFLDEERLVELWSDDEHPQTILGAIQPLLSGTGDVLALPHVELHSETLGLVPGDLGLSRFEDKLSAAWSRCHNRDEAALRLTTAFHRIVEHAAKTFGAELVLIDLGPSLGAINRAALIASDQIVIPLAPDLFSLQALKNLGPTLREWRAVWAELCGKASRTLSLPPGSMEVLGYVIMQDGFHASRPVRTYQRWLPYIPEVYRRYVLDEAPQAVPEVSKDSHGLALLKHYRSLMPMALDARKPMFLLKPADGALGAHVDAVRACHVDFSALSKRIAERVGVTMPDRSL